jgi:hypothetical protein
LSETPTDNSYYCDNCPTHPQFLSKDALVKHWEATHTVPMIETIASVMVVGQPVALPQPIVRKHVRGPDI